MKRAEHAASFFRSVHTREATPRNDGDGPPRDEMHCLTIHMPVTRSNGASSR